MIWFTDFNKLYLLQVPGQTHSFVQHIQLGVEQAAADPSALLLFSGGKTRRCGAQSLLVSFGLGLLSLPK